MWKTWLIRGIVIFVVAAFLLVGGYYLRKHLLLEGMLKGMQIEDEEAVRSAVASWPSPLNTAFEFKDVSGGVGVVASQNTSTILFWALARRNYDLAAWLVDQGADVNLGQTATWADGKVSRVPPLVLAAQSGRVALVKRFLDRGAVVNFHTANGSTPLHYAVSAGNPDIVALFLAKGADVAVKNAEGKTPLRIATSYKFDKIADDLRKAGAKE